MRKKKKKKEKGETNPLFGGLPTQRTQKRTDNVFVLQSVFYSREVIIVDELEPWRERAELVSAERIGGRRDSGDGAAPKVILGKDYLRLVIGHPFESITPPSTEFAGSFHCFYTRIHR